jgi:phytoene/squalene synthetase
VTSGATPTELREFGVSEPELLASAARERRPAPSVLPLLRFQAARARAQYATARGLLPSVDRAAMAPAEIMAAVYACVLDRVEAREFPFRPRVTVSRPRRAWIALRAYARAHRP